MRLVRASVVAIVVGIAVWLVLPPLVEHRRLDQAVTDLEVISDAARRYLHDTGHTCPQPRALLRNPGAAGWRGPYLDSAAALQTPWGGDYVFDAARGLVGIARDNARAPDRFRFGGIAELALPIREDPQWWPPDARDH